MSENLPLYRPGMAPIIVSGQVTGFSVSSLGYQKLSQSVSAMDCSEPLTVKLYRLQSDGTIQGSSPLASTTVNATNHYSFDLQELGIDDSASTVGLVVKAEDCNGDFMDRPVTGFNTEQDINARTTVISQIVNAGALVNKKLNEAEKAEVDQLLNTITGSTTQEAIDSLTNGAASAAKFTEIFGASPSVIKDVKPEIQFVQPTAILNEQQVTAFTVGAFHIDPNYSFVYKWKLDGVVKSSAKTWNYIPHANAAGLHQIDLYVGKNNGSGDIDISKPYYAKTFAITVGNNIQPTAPALSIHASTPSPRTTNTIKLNITTGLNMANCESFSHMALTDSNVTPGIAQFNMDCTTSGTQTLDLTLDGTNGHKNLYLWAIDDLGMVSLPQSVAFTVDSTPPVPVSLVINNGVSHTGNKNVLVNFSAQDDTTDITAFCFRYNNTTVPSVGDSCWTTLSSISVATSTTLTISNYQYQLGSVVGDYNVTVWYKNSANLISSMTSTSAVDAFTMNYSPDPPPTLSNILAAGFDNSASPLGVSDTTVTIGNDLYIKWTIDDNHPIPSGNVALYYTTNDSTYTTIATGLNNSINGGCTITGAETGCYKWTVGSPVSSYYRIKLVVTDTGGSIVFDMSNPLNTGPVKFLSGNTSLGIGGMATNAMLFSPNEPTYNDDHDNQAIVVTKTGYVFFRSYGRGLVYVSPHDGIIRDVALQTGTASGDGGNVFNATFRAMSRMAIDYDDNVLIWDYNKVRKIDTHTTPWTISTLFGGGADTSDGAAALSASISSSYSDQMTVMPNGRIYFNKSNEIWYFDPTDSKVKKYIALTGVGTDDMASWRATYDNVACPGANAAIAFTKADSNITKIMRRMSSTTNAACGSATATYPYYNTNFDLTTGEATAPHPPQTTWSSAKFTGLDGNIYVLWHGRGTIRKYDPVTNTFVTVVGNGVNGRCDDGTPALSCPMVAMSAFVTEFGRIYFVDLGVLRTVDSSGLVQTIGGQPRNFGVGYNPISARYSQIAFFEKNGNDVYVKNEQENQILKFSLTGGNLQLVAGNTLRGSPTIGASATTSRLPNCGWGMPCGFLIDSANNRLYHYSSANNVAYINLTTGLWVTQASNVVQDSVARVSYVGLNADGLLAYVPSSYGVTGTKNTMRMINQSTMVSTNIYGVDSIITSTSGTVCVGVSTTTCSIPHTQTDSVQTRYTFDSTTGNWLYTIRGQTSLYSLPSMGGVATLFETMNNAILSYDFYKSGGDDFIFYCSTAGNLYKRNITTNVETALPLPISSMKCSSNSLFYDAGRNSLIFAYKQGNLYGIAEYTNP